MYIQITPFRAITLALVLGMSLHAQKPTTARDRPTAHAPRPRVTPKVTTSPSALTSTTISEVVAQNVTLAGGASQQFFAQSDFSGADKVALGFYATTDQDLSGTTYLVWWAPPGAPNYVVADYLLGNQFAFLNSGGVQVVPYGNQLMIEVRNTGTDPVTISQITAYAVAR